MSDFTKVIRIGTLPPSVYGRSANLFCKIEYRGTKLSISGVEGPLRNGDAIGACGQIGMEGAPREIVLAEGWTTGMMQQFYDVWDEWHLNDMRAGSPLQTAWIRAHKSEWEQARSAGNSHYQWAKQCLADAGLQPDTKYLVKDKEGNDQPYSYGSKWLGMPVPPAVLAFLQALPDTDVQPNWI